MKKSIIQVFYTQVNAGRSKKTGNDYDMRMAQCMVELTNAETGEPTPLVGVLLLPEKYKDISPGRYEVEFEIAVGRDQRIVPVVSSMVLIKAGAAVAAAPASPKA